MKKILYILLFSISINSFSQVGIVTYKASLNVDGILENVKNKGGLSKDVIKELTVQLNSAEDINYELKFCKKESVFKKTESMVNDFDNSFNLTEILAGSGATYVNIDSKEILEIAKGFKKTLINRKYPKWSLLKEKKIIDKYVCYKAITQITKNTRNGTKTHKIVAWYTKDIPVSFGPSSFCGLPGLILELKDERGLVFTVEKLMLNPIEEIKINRFKGKIVTSEEINEMAKKRKDFMKE